MIKKALFAAFLMLILNMVCAVYKGLTYKASPALNEGSLVATVPGLNKWFVSDEIKVFGEIWRVNPGLLSEAGRKNHVRIMPQIDLPYPQIVLRRTRSFGFPIKFAQYWVNVVAIDAEHTNIDVQHALFHNISRSSKWYNDASAVPVKIMWGELLLNVVWLPFIYCISHYVVNMCIKARRQRNQQCHNCKYPDSGNGVCPECGAKQY